MEGYCLHIDFDGCNIFGSFMCVHEIDQKVNKSADECGSEQNGWTLCTTVLIEIEIEGDVIEIGLLLKLYIKKACIRIRTGDLLLTRQVLYQLSYTGLIEHHHLYIL